MTGDVLAALPRRVRRQLPNDQSIRYAFRCWVGDRDAVLILSDAKVVVVGIGGWFHDDAPLESAWLTQTGERNCDLRLWNTHRKVRFDTAAEAERAVGGFNAAAQLDNGDLAPLGPDDRLVPRCVYLGGVNVPVPAQTEVDLLFASGGIRVHRSPHARGSQPMAELPYAPQFKVELSGPGRFTSGGGFVGGGIGLEGAAGGMALAGVLNALTTRTRVESVIAVLSAQYEGFFLCREHGLEELRRTLAPVFLRARQNSVQAVVSESEPASEDRSDLVVVLERLTALHRAGALTDEEFRSAKAKALETGP